MSISIRPATTADLQWIQPLLVQGTADGHFAAKVAQQGAFMFMAIIQGAEVQMAKLRHGMVSKAQVTGTVRVAEISGAPSGFLLTLDDQGEREAHLSATIKSARRQGCFDALMASELAALQSGQRIIARCYRKSTWALGALENKHQFRRVSGEDPIELERFG